MSPSLASTVSLVINHTPWRPERVAAFRLMMDALSPMPGALLINDTDYRGQDWQKAKVDWALAQWRWSLATGADVHLFMTDDLHLAPGFWSIFGAMLKVAPGRIIGLLSNHPRGPELARDGWRWYQTNSWLVGPCYAVPHVDLEEFVPWFEAKPDGPQPGGKAYGNDDSTLNEWITYHGRTSLHPLPTIIEHRLDVESSVGHGLGDQYSRERVSWRATRSVRHGQHGEFAWMDEATSADIERMKEPAFWLARGGPAKAPMQAFPGEEARVPPERRGVQPLGMSMRPQGMVPRLRLTFGPTRARQPDAAPAGPPAGMQNLFSLGTGALTGAGSGKVFTLPDPPTKPKS